jgi:hypothetical protein
MKPLRITSAILAVGLATMAADPADAAWNNVFQVTCWHCRPHSSSGYFAAPVVANFGSPGCCDPCPQPCPQTQCVTKYVQRCYYQPVTCYQTQTYYEQVTTYRTSYYYEPCTTYRYSCYFDPCTCSYQQVACPVTSYKLRSQCCPVQSWVQRCCQVPVTTYQKSFYWEPQTTCCTTTTGAPIYPQQPPQVVTPPAGGGPYQGPYQAPYQTQPPPSVEGKGSFGGNPAYDQYFKQSEQPGGQQSQFRQLSPNGQPGLPGKQAPASPPPNVKLDKIAQADGTLIQGQVVSDKNAPKAGVQVTFVSVQKQSADQVVTSNAAGHFQVQLPAGSWLVYMRSTDGQYVFHSRIDIDAKQKTPVILVSR